MISGMYLGDIVRRVLHRIAQESGIFGDTSRYLAVPFMLRCIICFLSLPFFLSYVVLHKMQFSIEFKEADLLLLSISHWCMHLIGQESLGK